MSIVRVRRSSSSVYKIWLGLTNADRLRALRKLNCEDLCYVRCRSVLGCPYFLPIYYTITTLPYHVATTQSQKMLSRPGGSMLSLVRGRGCHPGTLREGCRDATLIWFTFFRSYVSMTIVLLNLNPHAASAMYPPVGPARLPSARSRVQASCAQYAYSRKRGRETQRKVGPVVAGPTVLVPPAISCHDSI